MAAFLRVLRDVVYEVTSFLFFSIANTVCAALLVVSCLAPWRLCALLFSWESFKKHMQEHFDLSFGNDFDSRQCWREGCVFHFMCTVRDCFVVPFAVLAFAVPTRTPFAFRALCRAWTKTGDQHDVYLEVRGDLVVAGASAPFDLLGIAAAIEMRHATRMRERTEPVLRVCKSWEIPETCWNEMRKNESL